MRGFSISRTLLTTVFLLLPVAVAAQPSLIPGSGTLTQGGITCDFQFGEIHYDCIPLYIAYVIEFFIAMAGGFFLVGIMLAGYKFALGSLGQQGGKEKGVKALKGNLIGLAVVVLSYLLVDTIIEILT